MPLIHARTRPLTGPRRRTGLPPRRTHRLLAAAVAGLAALPLVALSATPAAAGDGRGGRDGSAVTVMTRNLYLGADIMRPILAVQGLSDPLQIVQALGNATDTTRDIVDRTDFSVRARLLARELATQRPDLVGLQEVALWRSGPMQLDEQNLLVPNATQVDQDFLAMLLRELVRARAPYRPVSVNVLSDVEAPAFSGSLAAPQDPRDVRLTMRDVILERVGSPVQVTSHQERQYAVSLTLSIAGRPLAFTRGYQWVDAEVGHGWDQQRVRVVNTHLEAFSSDIALGQAQEVAAVAGATDRTTLLTCDCNSDPLNGSVKTEIGDTQPHWAAYRFLTGPSESGQAGFTDTWLQWRPAEQGWTSGLSETVDDPDASGFDHRIDLVLARPGRHGRVQVVGGAVTGTRVSDRDPATGLWPSDHGGVAMRLRLR